MTEYQRPAAEQFPDLAIASAAPLAPVASALREPATDTAKVWKIALALTLIFNTAVALLLSASGRMPGDIYENLIYSHCIGLLICLGILVPRALFWRKSRPQPVVMALLSLLGMAFGLFVGRALAAWICGHPVIWGIGVLETRTTFVVSLIISLFATLTSIVYFWTREREAALSLHAAQERERAEIALRQLTETQLRLLRAQIEPHMLFNTLANLRALIAQNPKAAQAMLDRLIDFFRASLQASRSEWSSAAREFDLARDYLELIAVRLGSRLSFSLDLPTQLASAAVPSMLLQPLVENAIKHGIEPALEGGDLLIRLRQLDERLEFRIENSGTRLANPSHSNGGYGNQHIRERLARLYGSNAEFELSVSPSGRTLARVSVPIRPVCVNT